jgi:hypothetical protein
MANAASVAVLWALLMLIVMSLSLPTSEAAGVPESEPLTVLKVAQEGLFRTLKETTEPAGALDFGTKEYSWFAMAWVDGVPEMLSVEDVDCEVVPALDVAAADVAALELEPP